MKTFFQSLLCVLLALLLCATGAFAEGDADILKWERRLYDLGYRDGNFSGEADEVTLQALINFQRANGLEESGEFDEKTVSLLMSEAAKSEREYLSAQAYQYTDTVSLSKGSYGEAVEELQRALKEYHYFTEPCSGSYGDATEAAVYSFQLANGLTGTGVADGLVQLRLYEGAPLDFETFLEESCAAPGDEGPQVRRLQMRLRTLGFFNGKCTGRYGESTQMAVKEFQTMNDAEADGEADLETCRLLYSGKTGINAASYDVSQDHTQEEYLEICTALTELGYPADPASTLRTEAAVCEFQIVNGLVVSGAVDEQTLSALRSGEALEFDPALWSFADLVYPAELREQVERQAEALLGKTPGTVTSFEFVQYLLLKNGVALMDEPQLQLSELTDDPLPGQILLVQSDNFVCYGIASEEGSFIYRSDDGFVVRCYLNTIDANAVYAWKTETEDAAES